MNVVFVIAACIVASALISSCDRGGHRAVSFHDENKITLSAGSEVASFVAPDQYEVQQMSTRYWHPIRLAPPGEEDAGMIISSISPEHADVKRALAESSEFADYKVGNWNWRVAIPDTNRSIEAGEDCFMAIVVWGEDNAVDVYGSGLGWAKNDLHDFLSRIELRE